MRRFPTTRPSPALIVAMIALVLALAGTAVAGGTAAKISKKKVKAIAAKQIDKRAPGLDVNSAKTAGSATTARIATNVFSANLAAGQMLGSIPAGATSEKRQVGGYAVNFGRPTAGCTISASFATANVALAQTGSVSVRATSAPNELFVDTFDNAGNRADRDVYVQAICPG